MTPDLGDDQSELESRQDPRLLRALEVVAPGTSLREGVDNIINASTGALIVLGDPDEVSFLLSGGLKLDVAYTPALLYQVAKMDGAIVLDSSGERILWANVQLMPDPTIHSMETGTRHRTADRVARQTKALVISVSARRDVVSLYFEGLKYILQEIPTVLSKANQGLATLEKYRDRLDRVAGRLTRLELSGTATMHDAVAALQRSELVLRTATEVERYIIELGTEGRMIEMQLEETVHGVFAERLALVRDYAESDGERAVEQMLGAIGSMPTDELLDFDTLRRTLGHEEEVGPDTAVEPRGYRALAGVPNLPRLVAEKIARAHDGLAAILVASEEELAEIEGVGDARARKVRETLRQLGEADPVDPYLHT